MLRLHDQVVSQTWVTRTITSTVVRLRPASQILFSFWDYRRPGTMSNKLGYCYLPLNIEAWGVADGSKYKATFGPQPYNPRQTVVASLQLDVDRCFALNLIPGLTRRTSRHCPLGFP